MFNRRSSGRHICMLLFIAVAISTSCRFRQRVSLVVHDATIYTVDQKFSKAGAMAINDGKIVAIGTNAEILKLYKSDRMVDAEQKVILPGLIDAHCHFTGFATDMWKCDLTGTTSFEAILQKLKAYSDTSAMQWIYGRGWDQNDWAVKQFPDKRILDSLYPDRPVFLKRIDGHAALVNQAALDIAGITTSTHIDGGNIELKNGRLTGMLIDNAMDLVDNEVPLIPDSLAIKFCNRAQRMCFAVGLTGVQDCGIGEHTVEMLDQAQRSGMLKMKVFALLSDSAQYYDRWIAKGPYITERLHVGGFKLYADGALGSRGACLLHDYGDKPGWKGFLLKDTNHFKNIAERLIRSKLQMCTHAIGDSGNRMTLKIYAAVLKGVNDRRWRIEHAQVIDPADFRYFSGYAIIPSVQPTHATSDMYWAQDRLGAERLTSAYAYKQLLETNGWIPLGTDFPVEDFDPLKTFYAAVVRRDAKGFPAGGFQIASALTREEAIRGMTIWAATAAFEENEKGSLETGKAADFIIIDRDLLHCAETEILGTKVLSTFINGEKVY